MTAETKTSFDNLKQHGWPYDIHSFLHVAPRLATHGYRVIVPYVRGFGSTCFLSADTAGNGQQSVVASDAIGLMDALRLDRTVVGGYDWGARTANIMAAIWPERIRGMVSVSGISSLSPPNVAKPATSATGHFNKLIWKLASPRWSFDGATFDRGAAGGTGGVRAGDARRRRLVLGHRKWSNLQPEEEGHARPVPQVVATNAEVRHGLAQLRDRKSGGPQRSRVVFERL